MSIPELLGAIRKSETPFQLRNLLYKQGKTLDVDCLREAFHSRLDQLHKLYLDHQPCEFMRGAIDSLREDFDEAMKSYDLPPATPAQQKYVPPAEQTVTPDEQKYQPKVTLEWEEGTQNLLKETEYALYMKVLEQCNYNRHQSSRLLGVSVRTIRNKLDSWQSMGMIKRGQSIWEWQTQEKKRTEKVKVAGVIRPITVKKIPICGFCKKPCPEVYVSGTAHGHKKCVEVDQLAKALMAENRATEAEERQNLKSRYNPLPVPPQAPKMSGRAIIATCCDNKRLIWMEGLCLSCYKTRKHDDKKKLKLERELDKEAELRRRSRLDKYKGEETRT